MNKHVSTPPNLGAKDRIGLMNPEFQYTNAAQTDIRKTFERIKNEQNKYGSQNNKHSGSSN